MNLDIIYGPPEESIGTPGTHLKKHCVPCSDDKITNNVIYLNQAEHQEHQEHPKYERDRGKQKTVPPSVGVYPDFRGWGLSEVRAWKRCLECEWAWMVNCVHVCLDQDEKRMDFAMKTCRRISHD